jgi:hypothetical protein
VWIRETTQLSARWPVVAQPWQEAAATIAAQWQWPPVMVRVSVWAPKDKEMAVEVVVHAVEHEGAWRWRNDGSGSEVHGRPWRTRFGTMGKSREAMGSSRARGGIEWSSGARLGALPPRQQGVGRVESQVVHV